MNRPQLYTLSAVSGKVSRSMVPEIVVSFPEELLLPLYTYIQKVEDGSSPRTEPYLRNVSSPRFYRGEGRRFGYQGCASVSRYRGSSELHFELYDFMAPCVVASLHHTCTALNALLHDMDGIPLDTHTKQFIELNTAFGSTWHSHLIGGHVYPVFGTWLEGHRDDQTARVRKNVVDIMSEVWTALVPVDLKKYASHTKLIFMDDGRFVLTCFGDACDVGIYPDFVGEGTLGTHPIRFGCHNLDSSAQQLTLIAGLAELVKCAERDHSLMSLPMCA